MEELTKTQIKNYYKKAELKLLNHPQFRQYKLRTITGRWILVKKKIRTPEDLRKQILKYSGAVDIYQSTGLFLNPERIELKNKSSLIDGMFLSSTGFLDLDSRDGNLEQVKKDVSTAFVYLQKWGYKGIKIVFSGRGFHLYFNLNNRRIGLKKPEERIRYYQTLKIKLANKISGLNLPTFDWHTSIDIFRISRVISTINSKNGEICREIQIQNLKNFTIKKIK